MQDEKQLTKEQKKHKRYVQFSKILAGCFALTMTPVSIYVIHRCLDLAEMAITMNFMGALPYLTAVVGFVEAAVTIVLGFYFSNSKAEKVANAQYGRTTYWQSDSSKKDY